MADVPSTLRQWSATASSNTPNDSTSIGGGLADNLQEIQAVVRKYLASQGVDLSAGSTIDLSTATGFYCEVTGSSATVTSFGTESAGVPYRLRFNVPATLTYNATSLRLPNARSVDLPTGAVIDVVSRGSGNWEVTNIAPFGAQGRYAGTLEVSALTVSAGTLACQTLSVSAITVPSGVLTIGSSLGLNGTPSRVLDVSAATSATATNSIRIKAYQASLEVLNAAGNQNWYFAVNDADSNALNIGAGYSPGQGVTAALRCTTGNVLSTNAIAPATGYTNPGDISLPASGGVRAKNTSKMWCRFDGTAGSPSVVDGFNAASITKNGTGDYTVTVTNAINANGAALVSVGRSDAALSSAPSGYATVQNSTTVRVRTYNGTNGAATDFDQISVWAASS